jgi:hypothetical protein
MDAATSLVEEVKEFPLPHDVVEEGEFFHVHIAIRIVEDGIGGMKLGGGVDQRRDELVVPVEGARPASERETYEYSRRGVHWASP